MGRVGARIGRHFAERRHPLAVCVDLVAGEDMRQQDGDGTGLRGNTHMEAIPAHSAVSVVALGRPVAVGTQQGPSGIVEYGLCPGGIVARVESPQAFEGQHPSGTSGRGELLGAEQAKAPRQEHAEQDSRSHGIAAPMVLRMGRLRRVHANSGSKCLVTQSPVVATVRSSTLMALVSIDSSDPSSAKLLSQVGRSSGASEVSP